MEEKFKFDIGQRVVIVVSGEKGVIIGRAQYKRSDDSYLLHYKSGDSRAVEQWWDVNALEAVEG